jgi:hypothetical protein
MRGKGKVDMIGPKSKQSYWKDTFKNGKTCNFRSLPHVLCHWSSLPRRSDNSSIHGGSPDHGLFPWLPTGSTRQIFSAHIRAQMSKLWKCTPIGPILHPFISMGSKNFLLHFWRSRGGVIESGKKSQIAPSYVEICLGLCRRPRFGRLFSAQDF